MALGQLCFQLTLPVSCPVSWIMSRTRHDRNSAVECIVLRKPKSFTQFVAFSRAALAKHIFRIQYSMPFISSYLMSSKNIHLYCASDHPDHERNDSIPSSTHILPAGSQVLLLCRFHCVAARIACSMIANTNPLATCSICKQSNTRPKASPLA